MSMSIYLCVSMYIYVCIHIYRGGGKLVYFERVKELAHSIILLRGGRAASLNSAG